MRLFGTDGVRGRAGEKLNVFTALKMGLAAGIFFRKHSKSNKILVGKDTRRSGYMIENAIVSGLTAVGYNVIQIGPMPTPAIAYLTEDMRCDAGIMISASHNPYDDNGIKFFDRSGFKLDEAAEAEMEEIFDNDTLLQKAQKQGKEIGSSKRIDDVIGRYIVHIKNSFSKKLSLIGIRIVLDVANGAAYKVAPTIFSELGAEVFMMNDKPNGYNINDSCGATQPQMLAKEVRRVRADIGFALDGDADRLVVVDNKGEIIDGDKLIGALATHLNNTESLNKPAIVATQMSNLGLEEYLKQQLGIELLRCNVGDKYVLELMQKESVNFGGEQSGHIILSDFAKTGDGLLSALQAIAFVLHSGKTSSEAFNLFELYPQKLVNLNISKKRDLAEISELKTLTDEIAQHNIRHLIRYSGTENKLRILLEGHDGNKVEEYLAQLTELLRTHCA